MRRRCSVYKKLNVATSRPSADSALAKSTMNALRWPAPAPCPSISVAPTAGAPAAYTSAVVVAPVAALSCSRTVSSLGFFKRLPDLRVRLQLVVHGERAELRRQRARQHAIDLAVDDAGQRDASPLDHDVNRRGWGDGVVPEGRVAVDRPRDPDPE